ncbi:MAG: DinB family protein [Acidimicrobiales bacterium]|jgi:hypothetical protein|nr:DinB family protein [Acidimicrobiales bacterium]
MDATPSPDGWNALLLDQLTLHWETTLRPKLEGLSDDEYFWEPVAGCWSVRPRREATAPLLGGSGDLVSEFAIPEPDPPPVTTIAWRLVHLVVGVFGARNASHFGGPPLDHVTYENPATAVAALADLDAGYGRWVDGVRSLGEDGLGRPVGEAEGPYAAYPYSGLVLHIHREVIHHGAEILLLRDLYRSRPFTG